MGKDKLLVCSMITALGLACLAIGQIELASVCIGGLVGVIK